MVARAGNARAGNRVRDYDSQYGYADSVNRRARIGVLVVIALVVGIAWAANTVGPEGSSDSPPPTVLAGVLTSAQAAIEIAAAPTTVLADQQADIPDPPSSTVPTPSSTLATPPLTTTTPPPATTTTRPATTTTRPRTTTTTTTTLPPTTTTSTTTTVPPTTTTTTVPPTTTTTVPPTTTTTTIPAPTDTIHIHDLIGSDREDDRGPYARVEVKVRNHKGRNQGGVRVVGEFTGGYQGTVEGITNGRGKVIFESGSVDDDDDVTFHVTNMTHPDFVYAPEDNRRGPSITVEVDD